MKHKFTKEQKNSIIMLSKLAGCAPPGAERNETESDEISSINERIEQILHITNHPDRPATNMLFFIMYDITSNKVRRLVAKYLKEKGCSRIQRSIFLADLPAGDYEIIRTDLAAVQAAYDNDDSILILPVSDGYLNAMKIIGHDINLDIITHKKNTLFF